MESEIAFLIKSQALLVLLAPHARFENGYSKRNRDCDGPRDGEGRKKMRGNTQDTRFQGNSQAGKVGKRIS